MSGGFPLRTLVVPWYQESMGKTKMQKPLSEKERRACRLYAIEGYSKTNAYRIGMQARVSPEKLEEQPYFFKNRGWDFFRQEKIISYVNELLEAARAEDVMSVGRSVRQLEDYIQEAAEKENWTAVSQLMDKKLKIQGLMRDRLVVTPESGLSDEDLVNSLSGGDEKKAAILRKLLPKDGFGSH